MALTREKHIRYWRMCAQCLPDHYISNDSNRMTLGFFIISALDLLNVLDEIDQEERQSWISWIYSCQVPQGGFRGFTGTDLKEMRSSQNSCWDPAHLPATFFALAALLVLRDDLSRVKRQECLTWLGKLQRDDGSFGEVLGDNFAIEGDRDLRQCCCAVGIAYMLDSQEFSKPVINIEKLIHYISSCQDVSGGFGVSPLREPHSGLSYCAVAALSFIERLQGQELENATRQVPAMEQTIRWLLERQTILTDEIDKDGDNDSNLDTSNNDDGSTMPVAQDKTGAVQPLSLSDIRVAGFNGREGKIADTCYAFWNIGSLAILKKEFLVDVDAMRKYLFEITQHRIGGFGKGRDDPPDVLHSYLGLATLALFGEPGIKALDPTMCMSWAATEQLNQVIWKTDM